MPRGGLITPKVAGAGGNRGPASMSRSGNSSPVLTSTPQSTPIAGQIATWADSQTLQAPDMSLQTRIHSGGNWTNEPAASGFLFKLLNLIADQVIMFDAGGTYSFGIGGHGTKLNLYGATTSGSINASIYAQVDVVTGMITLNNGVTLTCPLVIAGALTGATTGNFSGQICPAGQPVTAGTWSPGAWVRGLELPDNSVVRWQKSATYSIGIGQSGDSLYVSKCTQNDTGGVVSYPMQFDANNNWWIFTGALKPVGVTNSGAVVNSNRRTVTASTDTISATDHSVWYDATSNNIAITGPAQVNGRRITLKRIDTNGLNTVTFTPASGTVEGSATITLAIRTAGTDVLGNYVTLESDGTNWSIVG